MPQDSRNVICVAGMHRSGTSMITRMLNLCGMDLGPEEELMPAAPANPEGYWEHLWFNQANREILTHFGGAWDVVPDFPPNWPDVPELQALRNQAIQRIARLTSPLWGWKDPCNTLTLAFWRKLIPNLNVAVCLRNPLDVARSLNRRDSASELRALRLWWQYNSRLLLETQPTGRAVTYYDRYFTQGPAELEGFAGRLGIKPTPQARAEACASSKSELRHSRTTLRMLQEQCPWPELIRCFCKLLLETSDPPATCADDLSLAQDLAAQWSPDDCYSNLDWTTVAVSARKQVQVLADQNVRQNQEIQQLHENAHTLQSHNQALEDATARLRTETDQLLTQSKQQAEEIERLLGEIQWRDGEIMRLTGLCGELTTSIRNVQSSLSWRVLTPIRLGGMALLRAKAVLPILRDTPAAFRQRIQTSGYLGTVRAIPAMLRFAARHYLGANLATDPSATAAEGTYSQWLRINAWDAQKHRSLIHRLQKAGQSLPRISVLMPVYNTPERWLNRAIQSVHDQVYENWELCIADDASTMPHVRKTLERWQSRDQRIKVAFLQQNGHISQATNSAARLATGDFVAMLDHDDELSPDALGEIALAAAAQHHADLLYTDNDKIDEAGQRYEPQFKGPYSPELLLSYMYFCHMLILRRSLYNDLGGMRVGLEGSQDHDLALRAAEKARKIIHVPLVLYHWRAISGSTALGGDAKSYCHDATHRSVQDALDRRGIPATVYHPEWATSLAVGDCACEFPDQGPSVAIIIPTRNRLDLLRRCIDSLVDLTTYRNYRLLIVDNESDDPLTLDYFRTIPGEVFRVACPGGQFNYAYLNNRAIEHAREDFVLLLNNDTEVIEPKWLSRMMGYASLPGVGSVGARLLYPDMRVQHAGIVHSGKGIQLPHHLFKFLPHTDPGYLRWSLTTRNVAAVTAACMVTPRKLFLDLGGFDQVNFRVAFNDVDYGYRLTQAGYRNIYCATAVLKHHESATRGSNDDPREHMALRRKWGQWTDPWLSRHLVADCRVRPRSELTTVS